MRFQVAHVPATVSHTLMLIFGYCLATSNLSVQLNLPRISQHQFLAPTTAFAGLKVHPELMVKSPVRSWVYLVHKNNESETCYRYKFTTILLKDRRRFYFTVTLNQLQHFAAKDKGFDVEILPHQTKHPEACPPEPPRIVYEEQM